MPTDMLATSSSVESSGVGLPIKSERLSPEPESSSPSVSPHSPSPARAFPSLLVPGFGLGLGLRAPGVPAASTAPFSPPPSLERFSPANLACGTPAIKQMEMMTRNCSDFMRSLAAKYNNQNAQESFPLGQTNGLVRGFDGSFPFKGSASSFLVRSADMEGNGGGGGGLGGGNLSGGINRKLDNQNSPPSAGDTRNTGNAVNMSGTCGITDFSSSQTLLNLVRTASAQSASQLENYLKGAVKRSADGESRLDPLDLSVTHSKRPRTECPGGRELRDFREFLQVDAEAAVATGDSPNATLRTTTGKPVWMALLDRRVHRSDCSPTSRTSPKSLDRQRCSSLCTEKSCSSQSEASDITHWTVDDVVKFVMSVDSCAEYAEKFREQSIDGATLPPDIPPREGALRVSPDGSRLSFGRFFSSTLRRRSLKNIGFSLNTF